MSGERFQGHRAKKRFGQNFLHDHRVLTAIAESAAPKPEDWILEIGPGLGDLTAELVQRSERVTAVELDRDLLNGLRVRFIARPGFELISADILDVDLPALVQERQPTGRRLAIANIPYYITTPILMALLQEPQLKRDGIPERPLFDSITVMVQKEVADRMVASPGSKDYGALSVIIAYAATARKVRDVSRGCFQPAPSVDSAVVELVPHRQEPVAIADRPLFWRLVASIYVTRRKQLRNSLKRAGVDDVVIAALAAQRDLTVRGETLDLRALADLVAELTAVTAQIPG